MSCAERNSAQAVSTDAPEEPQYQAANVRGQRTSKFPDARSKLNSVAGKEVQYDAPHEWLPAWRTRCEGRCSQGAAVDRGRDTGSGPTTPTTQCSGAVFDYRDFKIRASPWLCFFLGGVLTVWALVEKKGAVTFGDVYPGLALIMGGVLLLGLIKYLTRMPADEVSDPNAPSEKSPDRVSR